MTRIHLDLNLLRTFVAVAAQESFARAADEVFRTQAAVTQQMQRLETLTGCELFRRIGRKKHLTEEGALLLDYAKQILRLNDDACRAITTKISDQPVRLGACPDVVDTLLPEYLALSAKTYPGLRIEIVVGRTRWLASALRRGNVDMFLDVEDLDEFPRETLRTSPVVWIAGGRFRHGAHAALPLVLIDAPCVFRDKAIASLEEANIRWRVAFETNTLAGVRAALRAGLGITLRSVEMLLPDLKVLGEEFGLPRLPSVSFQLYHRGEHNSQSAQRIHDLFAPR